MVGPATQQEFSKVSQQFTQDWDTRKGTCPEVDYVYVVSNSVLEARWSAYKQTLQDQTVEEYYHGTKMMCNLSHMPCTNTDCGVCGIISTGLDRRCIRKDINFQRFGHGFYLAPNSSKCHDYTQGTANVYRAMLLCAVCPGRKYIVQTDHVNLKGPPQVYGQEGNSLNHAKIVVYNPDAVLPRYIIVYIKDGVHSIPFSDQTTASGGLKPRADTFGQSMQSVQFGTCKFPTCNFPKHVEGTKVYNFCSRTCAQKFSELAIQGMRYVATDLNCYLELLMRIFVQLVYVPMPVSLQNFSIGNLGVFLLMSP